MLLYKHVTLDLEEGKLAPSEFLLYARSHAWLSEAQERIFCALVCLPHLQHLDVNVSNHYNTDHEQDIATE